MTGAGSGLHHVDHGPADGGATTPLVVLVHGSLDRGSSFARVVRRLPDLHVVTYDRRGYHRSRHVMPRSYTLEDHIADLVDLIDGRPSVVVGHSYGGNVVVGAAVAAPGAVRAVGVYEPPLPWSDWWPRRHRSDAPAEDAADFAESFFRRVVNDDAWDRLPEKARAERRADGPALMTELRDIRRAQPPVDYDALTVPLILGRGSRSIVHHRRAIDALAALVPTAQVVEFDGAAHGAHVSHPDAFAAFVRLVLASAL